MDKLYRDITRLSLIAQCPIGQESFSLSTRVKDFTSYYFTRFVLNLTHVFKDFSGSEIKDYNNRHAGKIKSLKNHPGIKLDCITVPIPKGMVSSYKDTLDRLFKASIKLYPETLDSDLSALLQTPLKNKSDHLYDKHDFDQAKELIGNSFSPVGLSHSPADRVLLSVKEIEEVNELLLHITNIYYPQVITLNTTLKKINQDHLKDKGSVEEQEQRSQQLMTVAYRLSIFAIIIKHVQEIEHAFVKSLDLVLTTIAQ